MSDNKQIIETDTTEKKKFGKKKWIALGVIAIVSWIIWYGFQPLKGTIHVGICRSFAELKLRYPTTMTVTESYVFEKSQRLTYTYIDPFGNYKSSRIECRFKYPIGSPNLELESIMIDRRSVSTDEIGRFNVSIPGILASDPDITIPFPPSDTLMSLKEKRMRW